jgi:hypothetical protein
MIKLSTEEPGSREGAIRESRALVGGGAQFRIGEVAFRKQAALSRCFIHWSSPEATTHKSTIFEMFPAKIYSLKFLICKFFVGPFALQYEGLLRVRSNYESFFISI